MASKWRNKYGIHKRRVQHRDPTTKPIIPSFEKVNGDLIKPLLMLDGKFCPLSAVFLKHIILVQACDLALHFTARLAQSLLLGALKFDYDKILGSLRKIAECWQHNRREMENVVTIINNFKEMVENRESAWKVWKLIE